MKNNSSGYTLIEILIVMVIMSIVATTAVLSIHRHQTRHIKALADEITNLINLGEEEALLRPAVLALTFSAQTFQFVKYDTDTHSWQPLTQTSLNVHRLPGDVEISLKINGKLVPPNSPQLIISSDGDVTPFVILLGKKGEEPIYQITSESNGAINIEKK